MTAAVIGVCIIALVVIFLLLALEDGHDPFPPA